MLYLISFFSSFFLALIFTFITRFFAVKIGVFDVPNVSRKTHKKSTPLMGGVAVFLSFACVVLFFSLVKGSFFSGYLFEKHVIGFLLGGLVIVVGGVLDDVFSLKPWKQLLFPMLAALIVITSGIGIEYISNPFGETVSLAGYHFTLFEFQGLPYRITFLADLFAFLWLMGMMYTTKILDGIDGLVSGLVVILSMVLFVLSFDIDIMQPETAQLAIILAGAFAGFLIFNFHPAKIFLGESGSLFAGFMIGVLAIISGGKLATALLILSIPIVDLLFVIIERVVNKQSPLGHADTKHLHFRLQEAGFSIRQTVLVIYAFSIILGVIALQFEGQTKIMLLIGFMITLFISLFVLSFYVKKK